MNIVVFGMGVMGQYLREAIETTEGLNFIAGIEPHQSINEDKIYTNLELVEERIDAIIDFSHFSNIDSILNYALKNKIALVVATTGFSQDVEEKIKKAGESIPVLLASNTSLGVNVMVESLKKLVPMLAEDYDIEIIEKHHNRKIDSPSGTAKTILETINNSLEEKRTLVYGREGIKKREKEEIGVHVLRGGTIVGEHSVIFAGNDEVIEIKHEAFSRKLFANGAVKAVKFLLNNNKDGFYTMKDILGL